MPTRVGQQVVELVSYVVQQVRQLLCWPTCCQHARSISTCRDWNNKLANFLSRYM